MVNLIAGNLYQDLKMAYQGQHRPPSILSEVAILAQPYFIMRLP